MTDIRKPALPAGALIALLLGALALVSADQATVRAAVADPGMCWTIRPVEGPRLRCRDARGEITDHRSPSTVPFPRFPASGWDLWGRCWHDAPTSTGLDVDGQWFDEFGYVVRVSGAGPARAAIAGDPIRRCRAEPAVAGDASRAMSLASEFDPRPDPPALAPWRGVAGLASALSPGPVPAQSWVAGSPEVDETYLLRVEPSSIRVLWGDGSLPVTLREPRTVSHLFERSGRYPVAVEVEWTGWWSAGWRSGWTEFSIGPFFEARDYDVDEIVVRLVRP